MKTPAIVLGAHGQVGHALTRLLRAQGHAVAAYGSTEANLRDLESVRQVLEESPDAPVINAAAYTAVDAAEEHAEAAYAVNAIGPAWLAALCASDRPLIHFSTDYVFPGDGDTPYREDDATGPMGVYGQSKRLGELAVLSHPRGTVIRTAWVYSATGKNFLKTMLRVRRQRGALRVVDDQRGTPTHADDIAHGTIALLHEQLAGHAKAASGLYHLTAKGETTWHGFASEIFAALEKQTGERVALEAISTAEYPTPAARPAYSVLDCAKIDAVDGVVRPEWSRPVHDTVAKVLAAAD